MAVLTADFFEKFESFNIGDNPTISPNWDWDMGGGHFYVVDNSGDQVIESDFDGSDYIGYNCLCATDTCLDVAIEECDDDTYLIGAGTTRFGCIYDNIEPTFWADDYNVDDDHNITIQTTSLGGIKSLFE